MNKAKKAASKMDHSERSEVTENSSPRKKRKQLKTAPQVPFERTITTRSLTKKADKVRFDQFLDGTQIHPLLIDGIVDKIIEYVVWPTAGDPYPTPEQKTKDLRNIRLVCTKWSEQGAKLYRKNRDPEMEFGERFNDNLYSIDFKLEKFLSDMHFTRVIPVQRYFFDATFFVRDNYSMFKQFMSIFGPTIVELQLYFNSHSDMSFTRETFANLNLSKLKLLLIDLGGLLEFPYLLRRTHDILLEAILKAATTLEKFWFRIPEKETTLDAVELRGFQETTFQRLRESIIENLPSTVTCFYMDVPVIQ